MPTQQQSAGKLVDLAAGIISREIFVSDAIYQQEQEQIFARAWLFVGHESLIPNPGDFFTTSMGEESVILTRDSGGRIHVFLNTCRQDPHRTEPTRLLPPLGRADGSEELERPLPKNAMPNVSGR